MDAARLDNLLATLVAFDTETHRIQPGLLAPPLVLGSAAEWNPATGRPHGVLLDKSSTRDVFMRLLQSDATIGGANMAYDMLVMAVEFAKLGIDIMPLIFAAYESGRVFDLQIAEQLHAIAGGHLGKDHRTGAQLTDPETGKQGKYSLSIVTDLVLGRSNAKANDKYRQSYALFDDWPLEDLPMEARVYPVDDSVNTHEDIIGQAGLIEVPGPHVWPNAVPGSNDVCKVCGCSVYLSNTPCKPRKWRRRNSHEIANQAYTHFAMHLGAAWGFVVDQDEVDRVEKRVMDGRPERAVPFFESGIFRWKRERDKDSGLMVTKPSRNMSVIKRKVAAAYGCTGTCANCEGEGKVPSPKAKQIKCGRKCGTSVNPTTNECAACKGTGLRWDKWINCAPCDATGVVLESAQVPRTDGSKCKPCGASGSVDGEDCEECSGTGTMQGIGTGRDVLDESGDEELMSLSDYLRDAKIPETYIPWLRSGRLLLSTDEMQRHIWKNIPLTLKPNVLLETGRTSYNGCVQLLPRQGGIRECIVARPGRVFCSVDYEAGELVTHAQSTLWLVGYSKLAEALNAGVKVHNAFAATVLGVSYKEFQERFAMGDLTCKNVRQAAKPANFGFPGRMGAATLVITQRKQGPDTACENGPTWILDDDGNRVRGYKGLRFCILMDGAKHCGVLEDGVTPNKVTEWKGREIKPACKHCIECAERLRAQWLEQWPENPPYFEIVKYCEENGQPLTPEQQELFGVDALNPGEIVQHVSNRIRGGAGGNAIANGWFQALLADATKSALRRASREMYDSTFRMPDGSMSPLFGSRFILFAHDELIAELPEATAHEAAMRLSQVMVEELQRYCPDLKKACKAEPALMRRWYKGAEPRWRDGGKKAANENDRLVPWEPKKKAAA